MSAPCTCTRLRLSSRRLAGVYDGALSEAGVSTVQFALLRMLGRLGPVSITELAEASAHDRSTLSRNLRPLEAAGLVALSSGGDQRRREVSLTPAGTLCLERALPRWEAVQAKVAEALGPDAAVLDRLLSRIEELAP